MPTESVKIVIDAEDKATAKIRKSTEAIKKNVAQVKEVGGQAKASTEFVGALATSMGSSEIGGYAGQLAMLTERVSAFSEVAKGGGLAALAFKGGLVAVAGVIGFQVGKALGNIIFQTDKWTEALERANAEAQQLTQLGLTKVTREFGQELEKISFIEGFEQQQEALNNLGDNVKRNISNVRAELEVFRSMDQFKNVSEEFKQQEARARGVRRTRQELEAELQLYRGLDQQIKAKTGSHAEEINKLKMVAKWRAEHAKHQEDQIKRIADAEKKKEDARKAAQAKELAVRERIANITKSSVDNLMAEVIAMKDGAAAAESFKLQLQGIDKGTADSIAAFREKLNKIKAGGEKDDPKTPFQSGDNAAKSSRFLTGAGSSNPQVKIAANTKKQADLTEEQKETLDDIAKSLQNIDKKTVTVAATQTVGD